MDVLKTLDIAGSGLSAQRLRMQTISTNMANARTTRTAEGGPYRRRAPMFESQAVDPFGSALDQAMSGHQHHARDGGLDDHRSQLRSECHGGRSHSRHGHARS
jgi:flagellar basal-body rod protein FlgC